MSKVKPLPCPFCGGVPTGRNFASTVYGPALVCDYCDADGPPALHTKKVKSSEEEKRLEPRAIERWNKRAPA